MTVNIDSINITVVSMYSQAYSAFLYCIFSNNINSVRNTLATIIAIAFFLFISVICYDST